MMLKHLEEHPEDFKKITGYGQWEKLADGVYTHGTFIEQRVLTDVKKKVFKDYARKQMLGAIVKQTIAPEEEVEDEVMYVGTGVGNPAQIASQQHLQLHKLYQQQMALNAAQGITYGAGGVGGMGANLLGTTSTTSTYTQP
jgi:hypothetical protein